LALGYLSGPYRGDEAVAALYALRLLLVGRARQLQEAAAATTTTTTTTATTTTTTTTTTHAERPEEADSDFFPPSLCAQLLAVSGLLLEHGRDEVPVAAALLVQQVASFLSASYLEREERLGEECASECVDQCAMVLVTYARRPATAASSPPEEARAAAIATALGELGSSLPLRLGKRFLAPLLGLCCRVLRVRTATPPVQRAALLSLHQLLPVCSLEARAAAVTLLCADRLEDVGEAAQGEPEKEADAPAQREVVVRALFLVATQLPTAAEQRSAHAHCCAYLSGVLRASTPQWRAAQLIVLQTLTAWLQNQAQYAELSLLYAQALGPAVVLLCRQFSGALQGCGAVELPQSEVARALLDQCVRFLVLAHAHTAHSLLGLLLPLLIALLDASQAHHTTVLQILLGLVQQSGPQSKAVLDQLPTEERARLEEAVRQKVALEQEAQRAAELAAQQLAERRRMPGEINFDAF